MSLSIYDLFLRFLGTFIAIYGFAIVQETPKKFLWKAALVGGISGLVYWIAIAYDAGEVMASFVSALVAAMMSHAYARIYKVPVTLFLVAGILPTVPGAGMYRTVSSFMAENDAMTMYYLTQTFQIAGVIALAVFVVDSLFGGTHFSLLEPMKKKEEET